MIVIFQNVFNSPRKSKGKERPQSSDTTAFDLEKFYYAFVNKFRHSEDYVKALAAQFVPVFHGQRKVLDVGCGRGEFLEVMVNAGIEAYGVDRNPEMITLCRSKNLHVVQSDWKDHLAGLEDNSLGGVFSAQFVEHLEGEDMIELISLAHRKLRPGGCLVVETLRPCVNTLLTKFFVDFTHRSPINPEALSFLVSQVGFREVEVRYYNEPLASEMLQPLPDEGSDSQARQVLNQNFEKLNRLSFLPHYYCVLAIKERPASSP